MIKKSFFIFILFVILIAFFLFIFFFYRNTISLKSSSNSISLDNDFSGETIKIVDPNSESLKQIPQVFSEFSTTQIGELSSEIFSEELIDACATDRRPCSTAILNATEFENTDRVNWLKNNDRVFAYKSKNQVYIFPKGILSFHIVVNTQIDSEQIFISYSPYTGAARAYIGQINGNLTLVKWSGYFYKSSPVLQDAIEGNFWSQLSGKPLAGPAVNKNVTLEPKPLIDLTWEQAQTAFPNGLVMTRNTGYKYNYAIDQYEKDLEADTILFSRTFHKSNIPAKTWVYAFQVLGKKYAIRENDLPENNKEILINIIFNEKNISLKNENGVITVNHPFNVIYPIRIKWFAWLAHYPDTELLNPVQ